MSSISYPLTSFDGYHVRDLFHMLINHEDNYDKLDVAHRFVQQCHNAAEERMQCDWPELDPDFPDHFTFIPYDREKIDAKMEHIFATLWKNSYTDWAAAGMKPSEKSEVWWADTPSNIRTWMVQRAPFNLTDGGWLRGIAPTGPMTEPESKLFTVFIDELGNGDLQQNHCNIYLQNLKEVGFHIPDVRCREFVEMKEILDTAWVKPVLALAVSLFSRKFFPELLGYTLWLETDGPSKHMPVAKIMTQHSLPPMFSLLHVAVDNTVNGHAKVALDAIHEYLAEVRKRDGEIVMQEHWRRVWIGYTAYATTGGFDDELREHLGKKAVEEKSPTDEFVELLLGKKNVAKEQHGNTTIRGTPIDELFRGDPYTFAAKLADSTWVIPGEPWNSEFVTSLLTFNGPMYQIFSADEINVVVKWILSLKRTPATEMYQMIIGKRIVAKRSHGRRTMETAEGRRRIDSFFDDPVEMMKGLKFAGYCDYGADVSEAKIFKAFSRGRMAEVFAPKDHHIIKAWIEAGCPLPENHVKDSLNIKSNAMFSSRL